MKIENNSFVALHYTLSLDSGEVVDQSEPETPLGFIFGAGQILPGLEKRLEGMEVGSSAKVVLDAEDGYGVPSPELVLDVPRDRFPDDVQIEPGMKFQTGGPHGSRTVSVVAVKDDMITVDINHPLAGERLHFDVKIAEVRAASQEELDELRMEGGCGGGCCGGCGEEDESEEGGCCGEGEHKGGGCGGHSCC